MVRRQAGLSVGLKGKPFIFVRFHSEVVKRRGEMGRSVISKTFSQDTYSTLGIQMYDSLTNIHKQTHTNHDRLVIISCDCLFARSFNTTKLVVGRQ